MLGDIDRGTAVLAAEREALQQAQRDQQDRRGNADRRVGGQQADRKSGRAHDAHRDQERVLAANEIAQSTEHQRAEGSHRESCGECGERKDEAGDFIDSGEELAAEHCGDQAVEIEVIPFEHRAQRGGTDDQRVVDRPRGNFPHKQPLPFSQA